MHWLIIVPTGNVGYYHEGGKGGGKRDGLFVAFFVC